MSNFEKTLKVLQKILSQKLNKDYKSLRIEGSHKPGDTKLFFIIFKNGGYDMELAHFKNFRMYHLPLSDDFSEFDKEVVEYELKNINDLADKIQNDVLKKYMV